MGGGEGECEAESTGWGISGAVFGGDDGGGVDEGDGDGGECVVGDGVEGGGDGVFFCVERHSRSKGCCITSSSLLDYRRTTEKQPVQINSRCQERAVILRNCQLFRALSETVSIIIFSNLFQYLPTVWYYSTYLPLG